MKEVGGTGLLAPKRVGGGAARLDMGMSDSNENLYPSKSSSNWRSRH